MIKQLNIKTGKFRVINNKFRIGLTSFMIRKRKKVSENKPELYLIQINPFSYISSLYPVSNNIYQFDYNNAYYSLILDKDTVKITSESMEKVSG